MTDYTIFLEIGLILLASKGLSLLFRKIGVPQVVGILVAGLMLGPVLHWVKMSIPLKIMAEIGVVLLMFGAGLETNMKDIKETGLAALWVAAAGVLLPLIFGFLMSAAFNGGFKGMNSEKVLKNVFIGVIMTATSVSITVEVLRELGKLRTKAGTIILSAAIIDDVIGIIVLTVVIGFKNADATEHASGAIALLKAVLFFIGATAAGIGLHYLFKWLSEKYPHKRRLAIFAIGICFLFAYVGERFCDVADITAAYIAGLVLSGLRESEYIDKKVMNNVNTLFGPIFFAGIGISASFSGLSLHVLWFALAFVAVAAITKFAGCFLASKSMKYSTKDSLIIGTGMVVRGEVCLVVMQKGIAAGLLDPAYIVCGVFLVLISSISVPIFLKLLYRNKNKDALPPLMPPEAEPAVPQKEHIELTNS